ncbi:hypothetical protein [Pyxidicoccus trucidator]|uniref:hypothetical protein n=1 Tax=Pyxidicoccus trucidator TaxID=2709662 RepID=UPI0013DA934A|nr:hypothetical protein [Pyxidicoccus trucidator]
MSIQSVVKRLQLGAVLMSAVAMLGACGEPVDGEEPLEQETPAVTQAQVPPPAATMSCDKFGTNISCSGGGSGGVTPYTYQWQVVDDFGGGSTSPYWYNGTTTRSEYCKFGFFTYGTYFTKYIRFRVVDTNGYVSNVVQENFACWSPN